MGIAPKRAAKPLPGTLKNRKVYVTERKSGSGFDIIWRDGKETHKVFRRSASVASQYAIDQQRRLDTGEKSLTSTIPFGDAVASLDGGSSGAPARELLWTAAVTVAQNPGPGPESLRMSARVVALVLSALRKFMPADMIAVSSDDGDDDVLDPEFWREAVPHAEKYMAACGVPEKEKQIVLRVLQGGKSDEPA